MMGERSRTESRAIAESNRASPLLQLSLRCCWGWVIPAAGRRLHPGRDHRSRLQQDGGCKPPFLGRGALMYPTKGYAADSATSPLAPFSFERRDPGPTDVQIDILFCGVCHSDIHTARGEWGGTTYPCIPGHEIVGRVVKAGNKAGKFREGDLAAVGCMVDSCRTCENCRDHLEQFCDNGPVFTYNSDDKHTGGTTYGGFLEKNFLGHGFLFWNFRQADLPPAPPPLFARG